MRSFRTATLAVGLMAGAGAAFAASEGSDVFSAGWVHLEPRSSSGPSTVTSYGGVPVYQPAFGTSVKVLSADTLILTWDHYWTDQISTTLVLGYPPTHQLEGGGTLKIYGVTGEGQQWSPAVLAKYNFGEPQQTWRPFVGIGVTYTWYRKTRLTNPTFQAAFYGPASIVDVDASASWSAVYTAGLNYRIDDKWSIGASLSLTPLKTRVTASATNTGVGVPFTAINDVRCRTLATALFVSYMR
jgi:outer membrane protein